MVKTFIHILGVMTWLACGVVNAADTQAHATGFDGREKRLLSATGVAVDFHVMAEGAIEVELQGYLTIDPSANVDLSATGHFNNVPMELTLKADAKSLTYSNRAETQDVPRPAALTEALLIGLTRMGILHNLAMLTAAQPPDHGDGGVEEWVVVDDFEIAEMQQSTSISFAITVAGQPSGNASLRLDAAGLPLERRQTVRFSDGEMRVTESYSNFEVREPN